MYPVILVHGLWMSAVAMRPLESLIKPSGRTSYRFGYSSVRAPLDQNADQLHAFLTSQNLGTVDVIAHSLGGLLMRTFVDRHPDYPVHRIVNLGTPHNRNAVAVRLSKLKLGRFALGHARSPLLGHVPAIQHGATAVIAGTRPVGLGRVILSPGDEVSDGTVMLKETRIDGLVDHIELDTTHFGMLFSRATADQALHFLDHGCFARLS